MTVRGLEGSPVGQFRFDLVPNAAFTTQGVSTTRLDAGGYGVLTAIVSVGSGSQTGTQFRVWLQGSFDGGTNWYPMAATNVSKALVGISGLNETTGGFTTNQISIINEGVAITATTVYVAHYNNPPPLVRAAWNINGTSATQTFAITCLLSLGQAN